MVDVYQMLDMLTAWVDSKPKVRGYVICDAEFRVRAGYGGARIAVSLTPRNPAADFAATVRFLAEKVEELTRGEAWKEDEDELVNAIRAEKRGEEWKGKESPVPPNIPQRAFADFEDLDELVEFLTGNKELKFYFDDEAERTEDPLIDP